MVPLKLSQHCLLIGYTSIHDKKKKKFFKKKKFCGFLDHSIKFL